MFLIDRPYVSDFLIRTIQEEGFQVISTRAAKDIAGGQNLPWITEEKACSLLNEDPLTPLYTNSENSLPWISSCLNDSPLHDQLKICKDKLVFRELIQDLFPDFNFKKVKLSEIQDLDFEVFKPPFVIKPSVGFFSQGVYIVNSMADLVAAKQELSPEKMHGLFPLQVLDVSNCIIEEYIEGEEFAIDCYYDFRGKAVILNILHHLFSSGSDTSDRVYVTCSPRIDWKVQTTSRAES